MLSCCYGCLNTICIGISPPSPACTRALQTAVDALKARGDEIIDLWAHPRFIMLMKAYAKLFLWFSVPPDPFEALSVGAQLVFADGSE